MNCEGFLVLLCENVSLLCRSDSLSRLLILAGENAPFLVCVVLFLRHLYRLQLTLHTEFDFSISYIVFHLMDLIINIGLIDSLFIQNTYN